MERNHKKNPFDKVGGTMHGRSPQKLKRESGFTLAETLMAVLILLMVSAVVATGIPAAANAYNKAVDAANAHVLLSTMVTALRDELGMAKEVEVDGTTVTYYSADNRSMSKLSVSDTGIDVTEYVNYVVSGDTASGVKRKLVSEKAITANLTVSYSGVAASFNPKTENATNGNPYERQVITFSGITVKKGDTVIAQLDSLPIRVLSVRRGGGAE